MAQTGNGYVGTVNAARLLPNQSRGTDLTQLHPGRDLASLYHDHFGEPRRERALLGATSFLVTWIVVRAITHAIRNGKGPFGNISPGGKHIHHMTFGITSLLVTGFLWMQEIGVGAHSGGVRASRATAIAYGAGAALTLDEFALWLNLEDDYWTSKGRESVDAVVIFGALMALTAIGSKPLVELVAMTRRAPRTRALLRGRRLARKHPRRALKLLR